MKRACVAVSSRSRFSSAISLMSPSPIGVSRAKSGRHLRVRADHRGRARLARRQLAPAHLDAVEQEHARVVPVGRPPFHDRLQPLVHALDHLVVDARLVPPVGLELAHVGHHLKLRARKVGRQRWRRNVYRARHLLGLVVRVAPQLLLLLGVGHARRLVEHDDHQLPRLHRLPAHVVEDDVRPRVERGDRVRNGHHQHVAVDEHGRLLTRARTLRERVGIGWCRHKHAFPDLMKFIKHAKLLRVHPLQPLLGTVVAALEPHGGSLLPYTLPAPATTHTHLGRTG